MSMPFREVTRGSDPHESKYRVRTHGHSSHGGVVRADAGSENCPHLGRSQPQSARVAALLMTAKASAVSNILEALQLVYLRVVVYLRLG